MSGGGVNNSIKSRQWSHVRLRVLQRDAYECQITVGCPNPANAVDHIVPRSRGGDNSLDNLRAACKRCNSRRGDGGAGFKRPGRPLPPLTVSLAHGGPNGPIQHARHLDLPA